MRTVALQVVLMFMVSGFAAYSQTTLMEYNYVTKGYRVQIESGLDMKKGYRFEDIHSIHIEYSDGVVRDTEFKALYRDSVRTPVAILCIYSHPGEVRRDYICIPQFNSPKEIWDSTNAKISTVTGDNATALMWGLAKLSSYYSMK